MSGVFTAKSATETAELEVFQRDYSDGPGMVITLSREHGSTTSAVFTYTALRAAGIIITLEKPFPTDDGAVIEIAGRKYARLQSEASDPVPWVDSDANPWSEDELRAFEAEKGAQRIVHFPGVAA